MKRFSESNFSIEVVSYLLACFFKEIHYACFYVYVKNCIKFSTLCRSSAENGSSFEVFDTATIEIIGFTSETILCINNAKQP